ncbi:hypothetical protein F5888DRAFT_1887879 [Russula emetica]|nr:hypothetical protein F5888DRAFT_1887879 [Russula emetica]
MPLPTDGHLTDRHSYSNRFLRIRMESHRAPGILQQLRLAVQYGLTCKLYTLSTRVVAIKVEIKLAMDEQQLMLLTNTQSATVMALRTSAETMV